MDRSEKKVGIAGIQRQVTTNETALKMVGGDRESRSLLLFNSGKGSFKS